MRYLRVDNPATLYRMRSHAKQPRGSPTDVPHAPIEISEPRARRQETALERLMGFKGKCGPTRSETRNFRPRHARTRTCPASPPAAPDAAAMPAPATGLRAARQRRGHRHPAGDDRLRRRRSHLHPRQTEVVRCDLGLRCSAKASAAAVSRPRKRHRNPTGLAGHAEETRNARETTMSCTTHRVAAHTLRQSQ